MGNKLFFSDDCIKITCDSGDAATHELIAKFYPVHANRAKTEFRLSSRLAPEVLREFRGVTEGNIVDAPWKIQQYFYRELQARENVSDLLQNGPRRGQRINDNLELKRHQQVGREIAQYRDRYAFFYDTRTGKTPLSLSIIYDDLIKNPSNKWLVVCPLILIENAWLEDARRFFPDLSIVNCHASTPQRRLKKLQEEASVYITNVESFAKYKDHFEQMNLAGCIVDESSTMKSTKSKVSKALVDFAQTIKRFYLLSGTPAPNGEWEYYMQLRAIDFYGIHPSYSQFKAGYFINTSYNPQYEKLAVRPDCKEALYDLIKRYSIYVDKEDVLTTPGRTFHEVIVDLPEGLKKYYTKMKNELCVELNNSTIIAPSAAAKLNKLNQITSGFVLDTDAAKENKLYGTDKLEWYFMDRYRFDLLQELLEKQGSEQVLIWANYKREFETIKKMLGDKCMCIYGDTSLQEKTDAIKNFKAGNIQYLVANPASADKGLTLTNCHICIYFSLNWSYELFKQSMERIYGDISSQPKHCDYYIIMARGTIDGVLYNDVLQGKGLASYAVLDHLKGGDF